MYRFHVRSKTLLKLNQIIIITFNQYRITFNLIKINEENSNRGSSIRTFHAH